MSLISNTYEFRPRKSRKPLWIIFTNKENADYFTRLANELLQRFNVDIAVTIQNPFAMLITINYERMLLNWATHVFFDSHFIFKNDYRFEFIETMRLASGNGKLLLVHNLDEIHQLNIQARGLRESFHNISQNHNTVVVSGDIKLTAQEISEKLFRIVSTSVFISHSSNDHDLVFKLTEELSGLGIPYWLDDEELHPGSNFINEIECAMKRCNIFVLVLSKSFLKKNFCRQEYQSIILKLLKSKKYTVIPVVAEECTIPELLSPIFYADFRYEYSQGRDAFVKGILETSSRRQG